MLDVRGLFEVLSWICIAIMKRVACSVQLKADTGSWRVILHQRSTNNYQLIFPQRCNIKITQHTTSIMCTYTPIFANQPVVKGVVVQKIRIPIVF
jgi:hypothetical protein